MGWLPAAKPLASGTLTYPPPPHSLTHAAARTGVSGSARKIVLSALTDTSYSSVAMPKPRVARTLPERMTPTLQPGVASLKSLKIEDSASSSVVVAMALSGLQGRGMWPEST